MIRYVIGFSALLALGGCGGGDRVQASLPNVATIDGTYTGSGMREGRTTACAERLPLVFTVTNGQLVGEVRGENDRTVTQARFESFVDNEGRVVARAWFGGNQQEIVGTFSGGSFAGRATSSTGCTYLLRLSRAAAR